MKRILIFIAIFIMSLNLIVIKAYDIKKGDKIYAGGNAIGIKLNTGIEVVSMYGINEGSSVIRPWEECGISEGDKIVSLDGKEVYDKSDILGVLKNIGGRRVDITYTHDGKEIRGKIKPALQNDVYSLGLYIKDSTAGIGTLTYYIKECNIFGALGHRLTLDDSNGGEIYEASITGIDRPSENKAGSKDGRIVSNAIGSVDINSNTGVQGHTNKRFDLNDLRLVGFKTRDEIRLGDASILTVVDGDDIMEYDIEITRLEKQNKKDIKGISFNVVDDELLDDTGGIIQGMSGSPIIQDEKIIGAVTHVHLSDSTKGFGIYLEWMFMDMGINIVN